ncbi:POTRA domain-containing protein [Microbulbifer sp. TB1203]|uniref:POTRA domain-containing protein n=1 Tax=Microbulbifer sp. TB1203 TaxID=3021712 RepID=UPI0027E3C474|nr:POTRA domain-containing protein [Microbulbifer sp. TB1203]
MPALVSAQVQQDAGSLLREQERARELERLENRIPQPDETPDKAPAVESETGETVLVKEIRYTGKVELLAEAGGAGSVEVEGLRLGVAGLQALADRITYTLQQQGFLLARAVLPPQDITNGVITIEIIEGLIEKVEFAPGTGVRIRNRVLRGMIQGRVTSDHLTRRDLEETLLRLNDLPGVSTRARLQAGDSPNTSRLIIDVEQAPVFGAALSADNHGSHSTGRAQQTGLLSLADISGFGDDTRVQVLASEGMRYGRLGFDMPLFIGGPKAHLDLSTLTYENIDDTGRELELEGKAQRASAGLDYALVRTRDLTLRIGGDFEWQALTDDSIVGRLHDKRIKLWVRTKNTQKQVF